MERGVGAFYYTMFQRTIATLTLVYVFYDIAKYFFVDHKHKNLFSISIASYTSLAFFMSNRDETRRYISVSASHHDCGCSA